MHAGGHRFDSGILHEDPSGSPPSGRVAGKPSPPWGNALRAEGLGPFWNTEREMAAWCQSVPANGREGHRFDSGILHRAEALRKCPADIFGASARWRVVVVERFIFGILKGKWQQGARASRPMVGKATGSTPVFSTISRACGAPWVGHRSRSVPYRGDAKASLA